MECEGIQCLMTSRGILRSVFLLALELLRVSFPDYVDQMPCESRKLSSRLMAV